jgi:hypothetical protein
MMQGWGPDAEDIAACLLCHSRAFNCKVGMIPGTIMAHACMQGAVDFYISLQAHLVRDSFEYYWGRGREPFTTESSVEHCTVSVRTRTAWQPAQVVGPAEAL